MASTVTRSQSSIVPLGCGGTEICIMDEQPTNNLKNIVFFIMDWLLGIGQL